MSNGQFRNSARPLDDPQLKFEGKIPTVQKLLHSQGITQNLLVSRPL